MGIGEKLKEDAEARDIALKPVPPEKKGSWVSPSIVYAGVEFSFAVVMTGAGLAAGFSIWEIVLITILSLGIITWIGDAINAYMGAKTGLPGAVIARQSFGSIQARIIVSIALLFMLIGWWAINTALVANAICAALGIDYTTNVIAWGIMVVIIGFIFIIPAVLGFTSMKWMDYVAVPVGLLIFAIGIYLSIKAHGLSGIMSWNPPHTISWSAAISSIIGLNVCQWVMLSDYSRMHKPTWKDSLLMPSLLVVVGFAEILIGAVMSVGIGTWDIIAVMIALGYPFWAYFLIFVAQWTSNVVSVYSSGLALGNMFNVKKLTLQRIITLSIGIVGIILALAGILSKFMDFLLALGIVFPVIGGIMTIDFFVIRKQEWYDIQGWNWMATITFVIGVVIGYYLQYVWVWGIPPVELYLISVVVYYLLMKAKAKYAPDKFTPEHWATT